MKRLYTLPTLVLFAIVNALFALMSVVVGHLNFSLSDFVIGEDGSTSLSVAEINAFGQEVKHAYQDRPKLRGTCRDRRNLDARTYRFPKLSAGMATRRSPQTDVVPMNLLHTNQTLTLEDWNAAEYTDVFQAAVTNIDERSELANSIMQAIGRREDQLLIDALEASATSLTVAESIGGANTSVNVDKLRRAARLLGDNGVEGDKLTYVGSHQGKEALLGETEATSQDYNAVRALMSGEIDTFMGFTFRWIASRNEGGLDLTSNIRANFAYAHSAMGCASGNVARMEINYIPTKTSHLTNYLFSGAAVEVDDGGVVDVSTYEA